MENLEEEEPTKPTQTGIYSHTTSHHPICGLRGVLGIILPSPHHNNPHNRHHVQTAVPAACASDETRDLSLRQRWIAKLSQHVQFSFSLFTERAQMPFTQSALKVIGLHVYTAVYIFPRRGSDFFSPKWLQISDHPPGRVVSRLKT